MLTYTISVSIRSTLLRYSLFFSEYLKNHSNHSTCPDTIRGATYQLASSLDSRPLSIEKDGLVYTVCACVSCPKILGDRDILVN